MIMSTTVRVLFPANSSATNFAAVVEEVGSYGEIARLDLSLASVSGSVLTTFFDVRGAQAMLAGIPERTEVFPSGPEDYRSVRVNAGRIAETIGTAASFSNFGEVENLAVLAGEVFVTYYDMRSAQSLLQTLGDAGSPFPAPVVSPPPPLGTPGPIDPFLSGPPPGTAPPSFDLFDALSLTAAPVASSLLQPPPGRLPPKKQPGIVVPPMVEGPVPPPPAATPWLEPPSRPLAAAAAAMALSTNGKNLGGAAVAAVPKPAAPQRKAPLRTKITNKDFSKFDIDIERIRNGTDTRTTVMVRNLGGNNARKNFLNFLTLCGLDIKYTFFYMPCKEHRNVLTGVAFINFLEPVDVETLYLKLQGGFAAGTLKASAGSMAPALSYARFQGHEELLKHFSTAAVMHEPDPQKRPIFNHFVAATTAPGPSKKPEEAFGLDKQPLYLPLPETMGTIPSWMEATKGSKLGNTLYTDDDVLAALSAGA